MNVELKDKYYISKQIINLPILFTFYLHFELFLKWNTYKIYTNIFLITINAWIRIILYVKLN